MQQEKHGPSSTKQAWLSPALAVGSFAFMLVGVNVFGIIRVDVVTAWNYLDLFCEALAFLIGIDARDTVAGRVGITMSLLFLAIGIFRVAFVLAWPGIR